MRWNASVLVVLALLLSACASGGKRGEAPDWIDGNSSAYPRSAWILGIGVADNLAVARDRARADLAKTFQVAISETSSDSTRYSTAGSAAGASDEYQAEVQRDLVTRTSQVLEGVTVPETWTDASGRVHALAVLNRSQAAMRLRQDIAGLDAAAASLLERARSANDDFERAKLAIEVVDNQRRRATAQRMLQAVDATGQGVAPRWPLAQLEADLDTALSRIRLRAEGEGEWGRLLGGSLAAAGFNVSEGASHVARLKVDVVEMPVRQGWHWRRAVAVLDLSGPEGRSLGQRRWEFKESATDAGTAEMRLREAIGRTLEAEARDAVLGIIGK